MKHSMFIDIIAPSSPPKNNQWKRGIKILQSWGFKTRFASSAISPYLFHANSDKKRALFLNKAFFSKDSSAVWMLRGGCGFQKLMPSFVKSFSQKAKKKLFIGYSDGTVLHLYLNGKNQETLHAPTISELTALKPKELLFLKELLLGQREKIVFKNLKVFNSSVDTKTLTGKIIGGNLSLISKSIGLPWFSNFKSGFLFLEDLNEEAYKWDSMLYHLFYSGALKSIRAVLFGGFEPVGRKSFLKVLQSFSQVSSIPFIYNLPCGHHARYCLPFNTPAKLVIQGSKAFLQVKNLTLCAVRHD